MSSWYNDRHLIGVLSMSRKLFAFLLSELKTIRVICQSPMCGAVTEMTPQVMELMCASGECPVCKHPLGFPLAPGANPLARLAKAIQDLQHPAIQAKVKVEIAVPETNSDVK